MKLKLSNKRLEEIELAIAEISAMQGPTIILVDGLGRQRSEPRQERIRLRGTACYSLRVNLGQVRRLLEPVRDAKADLIAKHSKDGAVDLNKGGDERTAFVKEWDEVLKKTQEVEFYPLAETELDLDKNNIPLMLLAALPFIQTAPESVAAK